MEPRPRRNAGPADGWWVTGMEEMTELSQPINNHAGFIWSVADLVRGDYKQSEYGRVILPLTVLRRLECVLDPVKPAMLERFGQLKGKVRSFGPVLDQLTGIRDLYVG